jgi:hypothetical protein
MRASIEPMSAAITMPGGTSIIAQALSWDGPLQLLDLGRGGLALKIGGRPFERGDRQQGHARRFFRDAQSHRSRIHGARIMIEPNVSPPRLQVDAVSRMFQSQEWQARV